MSYIGARGFKTVRICPKCGKKYPNSILKCLACYSEPTIDRGDFFDNARVTVTITKGLRDELAGEARAANMILSEYAAFVLRTRPTKSKREKPVEPPQLQGPGAPQEPTKRRRRRKASRPSTSPSSVVRHEGPPVEEVRVGALEVDEPPVNR